MTYSQNLAQACICCESAMELMERVKELCPETSVCCQGNHPQVDQVIVRIDNIRQTLDGCLGVQVRLEGFR